MSITAIAAGCSHHGKSLISDVSLSVADGEMLGLVGPNGSGKSTLMHLLAGVHRPDRGQVTLSGTDMAMLNPRLIARRIAFVEQAATTGDRIRVRDAVELGRTPWLGAFSAWSAADDMLVEEALERVEMSALSDRLWHTLSGGERQRIHLARALAQDPEVLLLDEPTNHLDIHHQLAILDLVRSLSRTTVLALHDLNYAYLCDRVCVMSHGRMVALGAPEEVLTEQLIREVFGVDVRFVPDPLERRPLLRFAKRPQPFMLNREPVTAGAATC
jgi:iron complex transport system ATP-binding protein